MAEHRLSQRNRDTAPIHSKQSIAILHFTVDLIRLADADQPFRASPSELDEISDIRNEISKCTSPLMNYGSDFVHSEGEQRTHGELILALTNLIIELKLRNSGSGTREIELDEIHHIRGLVRDLDQCRKRTTFYR